MTEKPPWGVFIKLLYCIVLYCIVLYCIVLYCIVLYCIVLYCIVLYVELCNRVKRNTLLSFKISELKISYNLSKQPFCCNSHWTHDLLNSSISLVNTTFRNGACKWFLRGYAGTHANTKARCLVNKPPFQDSPEVLIHQAFQHHVYDPLW